MRKISQVLLSSPLSRQPALALAGLIEGLAVLPERGISSNVPKPLAVIGNEVVALQTWIEESQSAVVAAAPPPQGPQEILAARPAPVIEMSEKNSMVRQLPELAILGGKVVPV